MFIKFILVLIIALLLLYQHDNQHDSITLQIKPRKQNFLSYLHYSFIPLQHYSFIPLLTQSKTLRQSLQKILCIQLYIHSFLTHSKQISQTQLFLKLYLYRRQCTVPAISLYHHKNYHQKNTTGKQKIYSPPITFWNTTFS